MHEINLVDKSFDQNAAGEYSISIQVNQNGITYCIADDTSRQLCLFRKHRFENIILSGDLIRSITSVLESDETLSMRFNSVKFMVYTQQSTLVPEAFFDGENVVNYLTFNNADDADAVFFDSYIKDAGAYNLFALPGDLVSLIKAHFKEPVFFNQASPFLGNIACRPLPFASRAFYLGLNPGFFDIACTGDGKLLLYNTFQFTSEDDLLYYIVFVCNKVGFDVQKVPLILSGELSSKRRYTEAIREYIQEIGYDKAACIPELTSGLKQLEVAKYLNLLNLKACASSAEHTGAGI